jgi:hypothetical protein
MGTQLEFVLHRRRRARLQKPPRIRYYGTEAVVQSASIYEIRPRRAESSAQAFVAVEKVKGVKSWGFA